MRFLLGPPAWSCSRGQSSNRNESTGGYQGLHGCLAWPRSLGCGAEVAAGGGHSKQFHSGENEPKHRQANLAPPRPLFNLAFDSFEGLP
jgi:hypothetical protein